MLDADTSGQNDWYILKFGEFGKCRDSDGTFPIFLGSTARNAIDITDN